jgi:hypothetical protein
MGRTIGVMGLILFLTWATASADVYILGRTPDPHQDRFVWQFDDQGSFLRRFSVATGHYGAYGLDLDSQGHLYAGIGGTVKEYARDGAFLRTVVTGADDFVHGYIANTVVKAPEAIYLASSGGTRVKLTLDGTLEATFPGGSNTGAFALDEFGKVYAAGHGTTDRLFRRWSAGGGQPEFTLSWAHDTYDMALDPQSNLLYALDSMHGIVYLHDLNGELISQLALPSNPYRIDYDPNSGHLFTMDMTSGVVRELGPDGNAIRYFVPPGCSAAYAFAAQVPEPASLALLGVGGAAMLRRRR